MMILISNKTESGSPFKECLRPQQIGFLVSLPSHFKKKAPIGFVRQFKVTDKFNDKSDFGFLKKLNPEGDDGLIHLAFDDDGVFVVMQTKPKRKWGF